MSKHFFSYCETCETIMITCGTCGNNTCNGTYGKLEDDTECPDCESAYELMYDNDDNEKEFKNAKT